MHHFIFNQRPNLSLVVSLLISTASFAQQPKLMLPVGHTDEVISAEFSQDGKKIITVSKDGTGKLWEVSSGKLLKDFKFIGDASRDRVTGAAFTMDGKQVLLGHNNSDLRMDISSEGYPLEEGESPWIPINQFDPIHKKIVLANFTNTPAIYSMETQKRLTVLKGHTDKVDDVSYSPDGKKIITASRDNTIKIWDAATAKLLKSITTRKGEVAGILVSPDNKKILLNSTYGETKILDIITGKQVSILEKSGYDDISLFSPDGKQVITTPFPSDSGHYLGIAVLDMQTGKIIFMIDSLATKDKSSLFSPDGTKLITVGKDSTVAVWDPVTGKLLLELSGFKDKVNAARYSADGKKIITASSDRSVKIWDAATGKLITTLTDAANVNDASFSSNGKKIVTASGDRTVKIWDAISGKRIMELRGKTNDLHRGKFSEDGKKIIISTTNGTQFWDTETGRLISSSSVKEHFERKNLHIQEPYNPDKIYKFLLSADRDGIQLRSSYIDFREFINDFEFSPDSTKVLILFQNNSARILDLEKEKILYMFVSIDSANYLITDEKNHYDGTEAARKLIYFTCGDEVIELEQVKDQLWVPNLGERINKGERINAQTLEDLKVCGLTPEVEEIKDAGTGYHFKITPRRGGLGQTVLYVNGIEVKRYKPDQLQKATGGYDLLVNKQELDSFFVAGTANDVTVKSYTSGNTISSRGLVVEEDKTKQTAVIPNLYAVLVGVSDYKDDNLDLRYAAKDATDISNALAAASRRWLNTDGKEHVIIYNLTTNPDHRQLPEKNSIKKAFQEIGAKATANDILFIFFSGHGVMQGTDVKKEFYFLTAEASNETVTSAINNVGISTSELTEWIKPANIKAQKRILILDACNSGQAIRDFVQLGKPAQGYIAARSDEKGQQIRAIEQLNNQSGLFILAASATDQSAFEMGRYSQGLLTYSLLKAIKQQPDILASGEYLDVSNWLNAAKKTVSILADESGARQEPQLNANNNFNIGIVDEDVRSKIILAAEKPLFTRSNFQNADNKMDNLKLRSALDKELISISSSGVMAPFSYSAEYDGDDAYSLSGDYKITGDIVIVNVLLVKGGIEKTKYEIKGQSADLKVLVDGITAATKFWLRKNK